MLYHQQATIYEPMTRILSHMAKFHQDVDIRDRALLYLRLLTHAGSGALGRFLRADQEHVENLGADLVPVLPKSIRLVGGPVPFLSFHKAGDERRKLGIHDGHYAVFALPNSQDASATDWRGQWGDNGDGLVISKTADECADLLKQPEKLAALLEEYLVRIQHAQTSIRLPFVLRYKAPEAMPPEGREFPHRVFALELAFSSSPHFVPISPIRIPFLGEDVEEFEESSKDEFPYQYRLLLKVQPLRPVATTFGVRPVFQVVRRVWRFPLKRCK
jgi:hypothetical protein